MTFLLGWQMPKYTSYSYGSEIGMPMLVRQKSRSAYCIPWSDGFLPSGLPASEYQHGTDLLVRAEVPA